MKTHENTRGTSGFTLVTTLMLMVMLSVVATGMLTLSAIELRKADMGNARAEARANARLALMIALGELQEHLGPDQRTTAVSGIFDGTPATDEVDGIQQPHWVNVWRTTEEDGSPFVRRSMDDGGLHDRRESGNWSAGDERLTTLVSGNEFGLNYFEGGGSSMNVAMVEMVADGSVGTVADDGRVSAPLVGLHDDGGASAGGQYAWWVGDLGVRANVATEDAHSERVDSLAETRRLQLAQDASLLAAEDGRELANAERGKLVSMKQMELLEPAGNTYREAGFHDFTTHSRTVLSDVLHGGLKKDLTAFLLSDGSIADLAGDDEALLGLRDEDRMIGARNARHDALLADAGEGGRMELIAPCFGLLRDWAGRADAHKTGAIEVAVESSETRGADDEIHTYMGMNENPAEYRNRTKNDISPVLAEGAIYYNISYYDTGSAVAGRKYALRLHLYPRVALWNPYNFDLEVGDSMVMFVINGGKDIEVTLDPPYVHSSSGSTWGGGTTTTISEVEYNMDWGSLESPSGGSNGYRRGSHYFKLEGVTIPAGRTVLFSPAGNLHYNGSNFAANLLVPDVAPDPSRSFLVDKDSHGRSLFNVNVAVSGNQTVFVDDYVVSRPATWREVVEGEPIGNVQENGYTQADDYFMYWKPITGSSSSMTVSKFARLPHGQYVSCAYQYGDEDEMPVEWTSSDTVPFSQTSANSAVVSDIPDRRTRDGFRLRWFEEHYSNVLGGGSLANTPHLETASIANWNVRNSYVFRSPLDNVSDVAPHFFGFYTRDLFDNAVSWTNMSPVREGGLYLSDPFNPPSDGVTRRVLFDVPRNEAGVASLGAFQHAKFSELAWSPSFALGNSLVDPRVPRDRTEPKRNEGYNDDSGGWNRHTIGYTDDGRSNSGNASVSNADNWAYHALGLLEHTMEESNVTFDLSFELNHAIWDRYFLSTGTESDKAGFASDASANPLPNGRMRLAPTAGADVEDKLVDFHEAATVLMVDGGFNVNSTSVAAWEAMLLSTLGVGFGADEVAFSRMLDLPGDSWDGVSAGDDAAWSGQRVLSRDEVGALAEAIVREVKTRGPFLSMSDFVNRRLADDETGLKGALQAAIDKSGINQAFEDEYPLDNSGSLPDFSHGDHIDDPTRMEQTYKPATTAWGASGFLTQADVLQVMGDALAARSDSFVIRAYGNCLNAGGTVAAEAWCEAVVQRMPEPVEPDGFGLNSAAAGGEDDYGRRFQVVSFRWLSADEV